MVQDYDPSSTVITTLRAAVIGDIHGCSDQLSALLSRAELANRDIFVLGDLCDRGPDTPGVLDLLGQCNARGIIGNHELWFTAWSSGMGLDTMALDPNMGGRATLAAYKNDPHNVTATQRDFLDRLELTMKIKSVEDGGAYMLIHAGLPPAATTQPEAKRLAWATKTIPQYMLWGGFPQSKMARLSETILAGHVPRKHPAKGTGWWGLDTGCGTLKSGKLTALLLPEQATITV